MVQRYGFPLDAAGVEGPPVALGQDGVIGGDTDTAFVVGTGTLPSVAGLHDGELAITYLTDTNTIAVRVFNADGTEVTDADVLEDIPVPAGSVGATPTLVAQAKAISSSAGQKLRPASSRPSSPSIGSSTAGARPRS